MESSDQVEARELLEGRALPWLHDFLRCSSRLWGPISSALSEAPRAIRRLRRRRRRAPFGHVLSDGSRAAQEAREVNAPFRVLHSEQKGSYRFRKARPVVGGEPNIRRAPEAVRFGSKPFFFRGQPPALRRELPIRRAVHVEEPKTPPEHIKTSRSSSPRRRAPDERPVKRRKTEAQ